MQNQSPYSQPAQHHQNPVGDPLVDYVQGKIREKTHLIQLYTKDPDEGPRLISDYHPKGIPIMVIVDPPSCCYWKLNVPHGIVSMEQVWGRNTGMMEPGYHCCYCSYKRIAAMITKNSIQFNTPIESCPTKDNVRVSVDIGITFHIGKEETRNEDCEKFLYYLGANKLEELLQQECEESIRNFVRTIKVSRIRDIKSELTSQMMEELNQRFNQYGVYIEQVNVMNVIIPKDLRMALQQATTYDVLLQNQVKFQENTVLRINNQEDKTLQTLKRENQKKMLDLNHQLAMEEILLEEQKVKAETDQQIAIISAKEKQSIKLIQAGAIKSQAQQRALKQAESILAEAKAYAEAKKIETNAQKSAMQMKAQVRYEVAKGKSQGMIAEAEAEAQQANNLDAKRKFEQKLKMIESMKTMVEHNKIIITGENADEFLGFFKETADLVNAPGNERGSLQQNFEPHFGAGNHSSAQLNKTEKKDIKTSLEQDRLNNKQKFEEPFYLKLGGGDKKENIRIVKSKQRSPKDNANSDSDAEKQAINIEDINKKINQKLDKGVMGQRKASHQRKPVVEEVKEEEEQSPPNNRKGSSNRPSVKSKQPIFGAKNVKINEVDDSIEKSSVDSQPVKTVPQLVKVDVNLDTLKNFLEDIQEAINDHAKSITISHYFGKISEGLHKECGERPHAFRLDKEPNFLQENFQTEDSTQLKRQAEKVIDKIEIIGLNIINFQKFKIDASERIEKLEKTITKCFTMDQFREESQLMEQRTLSYINDKLGTFQENLNGYKKELNEALSFFNKKVNDNQSETVWRIRDCEELLKNRVSDKFVNDSIKALEEKLTKQVTFNEEKGIDRLEKAFKELGSRIIQQNQFFNEKIEDSRKQLLQFDLKIMNMATIDKLVGIQTGQKDMKYNIERELEMLQEHVKETKDKISELNKRFSNLEQAAMNDNFTNYQPGTQINAGNISRNSNQQFTNTSNVSADKKNQGSTSKNSKSPDGRIQQNQPSSPMSPLMRKRQGRMDQAFMQEMEKKISYVDEQFANYDTKLDSIKKQIDEKVNKDDVRKLTSDKITKEDLDNIIPNEEIMQEKMKYLIRDEIENLQTKMLEQMKGLETKMIRLRAELDIHSIHRQLERKANEEQVRNDFSNHEFKISTLDRNIIRMAGDFETFQLALNKLYSSILELQDANRDVLLGKKTNNCLSCGKGGDTSQNVMGKDGKMYRGGIDQKGSGFVDDQSLPTGYMMFEGLNSMAGFGQQPNDQEQFNPKVIKPSNSFYDGNGMAYENSSLPSVHNKKNSISTGYVLKNIQSQSGISTAGNYNSQLVGSQSAVNSSFVGAQIGTANNTKKKLPFGFQVQKEKIDLFKVGSGPSRGKSSYANRPQTNRMEDNDGRGYNNFHNSFDM